MEGRGDSDQDVPAHLLFRPAPDAGQGSTRLSVSKDFQEPTVYLSHVHARSILTHAH